MAHVSPSSHDIQQVVSAEAQVHDALIDSAAAAFGCEVLFRYLHPTEGADEETHRPHVRVGSCRVAATPGRVNNDT